MKLEFLESGSPDCPLIRLYEFTSREAYQLRRVALQLARSKEITVRLHEQPNVVAIDGCKLTLQQGKKDRGVSEISSLNFECVFSKAGWLQVADLIRRFSRSAANGFQWLSETRKVKILLSCDGKW